MNEPTPAEVERAAAALMPFVLRRRLSLNPENVQEMAYAALRHARSDSSLDDIAADVGHQIDHHEEGARQLGDAMRAELERREPARRIRP